MGLGQHWAPAQQRTAEEALRCVRGTDSCQPASSRVPDKARHEVTRRRAGTQIGGTFEPCNLR